MARHRSGTLRLAALLVLGAALTGFALRSPTALSPRFNHVMLYVSDLDASIAFYTQAFGVEQRFLHPSGDYGELETGATTLAFASEALRDSNGIHARNNRLEHDAPGVEIAWVTDHVEEAMARAVQAGAQPVAEATTKPWSQVVGYVRDLNGVLVELCAPVSG